MRPIVTTVLLAASLLAGAAWASDDRPQPSTTPPPGLSRPGLSPMMQAPPPAVVDPRLGTSSGIARDRQSDERGIPTGPGGDRPPGISVPDGGGYRGGDPRR